MENQQYDEISLRELIESLLNQKKLIAIITITTILIAFVVSFFVLDPVYESKAILMASNINNKLPVQKDEGIQGLLDTLSQYPQMSIETYKEQISNPQILQQTIDELQLDQYNITRRSLRNMITLSTIKDTNLITISITYSDKKVAADIANTITKKFTNFVSDMAKEQATKSSNYITLQMEIEKENLDNALLEYKEYLSKPRGRGELQQEVDSKLALITQYKTDLVNTEIEEQKIIASLQSAETSLKNTPEKIILNKSLSDEPYMSQVVGEESNKTSKELFTIKVQSEEINEAYIALKQQVDMLKIDLAKTNAQRSNLQKQIINTQSEMEELQVDLAEKQHEERVITQKVDFAQTTYDAFLNKYEETRITKSSAIGDATIIIVSPAVEPLAPSGPRKALNMAIGTVLGLMLGVFIGFFREYWKNSGVKKTVSGS